MNRLNRRSRFQAFTVGVSFVLSVLMLAPPTLWAGPPCSIADVSEVGGTAESPGAPDGQLTVDDLLVFTSLYGDGTGCPGTAPCNLADLTGVGGPPETADGELTIDDLIAFINAYGDGCDPDFNDRYQARVDFGWIENSAARQWVGDNTFGGYVSAAHDVLALSHDPMDQEHWVGASGLAGDNTAFVYNVYTAIEYPISQSLIDQSGYPDLRIGYLVMDAVTPESSVSVFAAMWWSYDANIVVVPVGAATDTTDTAWLQGLRELSGFACSTCYTALPCAAWDAQAQLEWDMFKNTWDDQVREQTYTEAGSLAICAGIGVIGCGFTWWIPILGEVVCGVGVTCAFGMAGCFGITLLLEGNRSRTYRNCLCLAAAGRANNLTPPSCPVPNVPGCIP